jgi:hypothetical protein
VAGEVPGQGVVVEGVEGGKYEQNRTERIFLGSLKRCTLVFLPGQRLGQLGTVFTQTQVEEFRMAERLGTGGWAD